MRLFARLLVFLFILASCTPDEPAMPGRAGSPSGSPGSSGRIVFGVLGEPSTLDPHSSQASDLTFGLLRPVYPSLFRLLPDGTVESELATAIEGGEGRSRITLRPASWSDGTPITPADVVASWRRARPDTGLGRVGRMWVSAGAVRATGDPKELAELLTDRSPILPDGKRLPGIYGGPFVLAGRTPGLELVFERNPAWWGEPAATDRVIVRHIDSVEIMLALLQDRRLDAAAIPSSVNLSERLDELEIRHSSRSGFEWVGFAGGRSPVSAGTLVRSLDLEAIAEGLIRDDGRSATPRGVEGSGALPDSVAVPTGDELLALIARAIQIQGSNDGWHMDQLDVDVATLYGPWQTSPVASVHLTRQLGHPSRAGSGVVLFEVPTYVAWVGGVRGLEPNGSSEGPLWNMQGWRR